MTDPIEVDQSALRDALQRAHDGESPDAILEELREPCCEHHTVCQLNRRCYACGEVRG